MKDLHRVVWTFSAVLGAALLLALPAASVPTVVAAVDTPPCDPLMVPSAVDELGEAPAFAPFPDELISATAVPINVSACLTIPDGPPPNALVSITNLTAFAFSDLWYVADPETSLSNPDGLVNGVLAFKIDSVGINTPLVFESAGFDGIFAVGETWGFIIQDYTNGLGLPPDALGSIGVPSPGAATLASSGSIIAVPEPASAALLGLGLARLAAAGRKRRSAH